MEIFNEATPDERIQLLRNALIFLCDDDNFDIHGDGAEKIAVVFVERYMSGYFNTDEFGSTCCDPDDLALRRCLKAA